MPLRLFQDEQERLQKRWIVAALVIALFLHAGLAGVFELYKIPRLQTPYQHGPQVGPFTVKEIKIDPNVLRTDRPDPIQKLPAAEPPKSPTAFNLDPGLVEKALQTPQPTLRAPTLPDPTRVIAASDLTQSVPLAPSDSAQITADVAKMTPVAVSSDPLTSTSRLAEDLVNASAGNAQAGTPTTTPGAGDPGLGAVPGFSSVPAPIAPDLNNLPEPILLRLPSDVLFDFDSAQLKPEAATLLAQAEGLIGKYPGASVQVDGYSDSIGKPDYNRTLSEQRAQAVEAWLQAHATAGGYTYKSQGHGSAGFVVSPAGSIEQQQPNRRVEILIQALGKGER